ncbi:MAG: hypothetical protein IT424_11100 [Pirellulales bacterium]|nr:hypothetical protein [Pirellulales bacterium]
MLRTWLAGLLCAAMCCGCGCGGEQQAQQSNLRLLAALYGQFRASHRGQLPRSEQQLKEFIAKEKTEALSNAGLANVNELFVSKRDGQPYVIRYQQSPDWKHEGIVAYEQQGENGAREAATDLGGMTVLSDEQFQEQAAQSQVVD